MEDVLKNKTAVVYGAGSIGGAVARAFARAGATVFVADHNEIGPGPGCGQLRDAADGGSTGSDGAESLPWRSANIASKQFADENIETERLDVLDKEAVADFVRTVVEKTGRVDISFCATSTHQPGGEQGAALIELSYADFSMPIIDYTKATFNTASAVYPYMVEQRSGVVMGMTAVVSQVPFPYTAGFGPAYAAVESMLRLLAAELGPYGVRTVCLHSAGSDGAADKTLAHANPELEKRMQGWGGRWTSRNLLGRAPTLEEVGNMAVFMASDLAGATTATTISLNSGMTSN